MPEISIATKGTQDDTNLKVTDIQSKVNKINTNLFSSVPKFIAANEEISSNDNETFININGKGLLNFVYLMSTSRDIGIKVVIDGTSYIDKTISNMVRDMNTGGAYEISIPMFVPFNQSLYVETYNKSSSSQRYAAQTQYNLF